MQRALANPTRVNSSPKHSHAPVLEFTLPLSLCLWSRCNISTYLTVKHHSPTRCRRAANVPRLTPKTPLSHLHASQGRRHQTGATGPLGASRNMLRQPAAGGPLRTFVQKYITGAWNNLKDGSSFFSCFWLCYRSPLYISWLWHFANRNAYWGCFTFVRKMRGNGKRWEKKRRRGREYFLPVDEAQCFLIL